MNLIIAILGTAHDAVCAGWRNATIFTCKGFDLASGISFFFTLNFLLVKVWMFYSLIELS
jgi:thiosulfate reductase cytochrome b subunit